MVNISFSPDFTKEFKRLKKKYPSLPADLKVLLEKLMVEPDFGTDLGGGLRKIRMSITSKGRGKSSGARVISFHFVVALPEGDESSNLALIIIYDKAEVGNIPVAVLKKMAKASGYLE